MKAEVKIGRKDGFVSSYNLFFENGLRLMTQSVLWGGVEDRAVVLAQFKEVIAALQAAGVDVIGAEALTV